MYDQTDLVLGERENLPSILETPTNNLLVPFEEPIGLTLEIIISNTISKKSFKKAWDFVNNDLRVYSSISFEKLTSTFIYQEIDEEFVLFVFKTLFDFAILHRVLLIPGDGNKWAILIK